MNRKRILVVEDKSIISADLEGRLRRLGYEVANRADTGEAAIRIAKESGPDVVLMDIEASGIWRATDAAQHIQKKLTLPVSHLSATATNTTLLPARDPAPFVF